MFFSEIVHVPSKFSNHINGGGREPSRYFSVDSFQESCLNGTVGWYKASAQSTTE